MRSPPTFTLFLKIMLALECIVLLAPAILMMMMAGVVALGSLMPLSDPGYWPWHLHLQALGVFAVPSVFGMFAVVEVSRIAIAVLRDRAIALIRRTLLSAVSGGIAAIAGWAGLYVLGKDQGQTPLGAATVTLVLVGPVLFLSGQLWWLQVRLRRRAAPA